MKKVSILCFLVIGFCIRLSHAQDPFLTNLKPYEGKTFSGKVVFPEGDKDPFSGKTLTIVFQKCEANEVRIPFYVGEDKSRTWVLSTTDQGVLLKHDHRHEDGTPDEITMYGGYARADGTDRVKYFPADDHTKQLIPRAATNEWSMQLSEDGKTFSYLLSRDGELRFRADFDLK